MPKGVYERKRVARPERLTQERLQELLAYNPETGIFTWLTRTSNRTFIGADAGTHARRDGYVRVGVDGHICLAHRLAWLYMTGTWPAEEIDHRNTIRHDNRWENLRDASRQLNTENLRRPRKDNVIGYQGVRKMKGKFQANIRVDGRMKNLGVHATPELAHDAYVAAKRLLHPGCTL